MLWKIRFIVKTVEKLCQTAFNSLSLPQSLSLSKFSSVWYVCRHLILFTYGEFNSTVQNWIQAC